MTARTLIIVAVVSCILHSCTILGFTNHVREIQSYVHRHDIHITSAPSREKFTSHSKIQTELFSTPDKEEEDDWEQSDEDKRMKRKRNRSKVMVKYDERVIKPWTMADNFNSTTMKYLFEIKDAVSGGWAKVESKFASWLLVVTSKVERDIKTTFKTGDFVKRKITKETKAIIFNVAEVSKPLLSLPATIQRLSGKKDSWDLMRIGVNPLDEEQLLGNFKATNTKERAAMPKKKAPNALAADSVYRSVRMLPTKLKYDYDRKKIAEEVEKNERKEKNMRLLPDGNMKEREMMEKNRRMPLLPDMIYQEDVSDSDIEFNEYSQYDNQQESYILYDQYKNNFDGGYQEEYVAPDVTQEEAVKSRELFDIISTLSRAIKEGAVSSLRSELMWARSVAEETLDLEILGLGMESSGSSKVIEENGTDSNVENKGDGRELKQWGIDRVSLALRSLSSAIVSCERLEALPAQVKEVESSRDRERKLSIRSDDIGAIRRGIEIFVEGMSVQRVGAGNEGGEGGEGGGGVEAAVGWGGKQEDVKERIIGNRALLAGIYTLTDNLETLLTDQRQIQKDSGRTGRISSNNMGSNVKKAEWIGGGPVDGVDMDNMEGVYPEAPEGLIKESKRQSDDIFDSIEEERKEAKKDKKKIEMKDEKKMEKEKEVEKEVGKEVVKEVVKPVAGWSPGAAVFKIVVEEKGKGKEAAVPMVEGAVNSEDGSRSKQEVGGAIAEDVEGSSGSDGKYNVNDYFLFVADDSIDINEDSYFYSDTTNSTGGDGRSVDSSFVDTTVETSEKDSDKIILFLATSVDVLFFLFETIVKALGPILLGGGAQALDRAAEALFADTNISPKVFVEEKKMRKQGVKRESVGVGEEPGIESRGEKNKSWKLLAEFKKQV